MKKILNWLRESNRWKHLAGFFIGLLADDWYCAVLAGGSTAGAMELKDKQWGGQPDPIDFALTFGSCLAGHLVRSLIF